MTHRFISYPDLPKYGVPRFSRKHLLDLMKAGKFPLARQISSNRVGWIEAEILDYVASRPVAKSLQRAAPASSEDPPRMRRGVKGHAAA